MSEPAGKRATLEDLVRLGEHVHAEVIGGEIVVHLSPLPEHGSSLMSLGYDLIGPYGRGRGGPGGWWLMTDVDLELQRHEV